MIRRLSLVWLGLIIVLLPLSEIVTHPTKVLADRLFNEQDLPVLLAIGALALSLTVALFLAP